MKRLLVILFVLLLLCGCARENTDETLVPKWDIPNAPIADKSVIQMQYFSVKLPPDWEGLVVDSIEEFSDGTCSITFYERERWLLGSCGKICSIHLLQEGADWTSLPGTASLYGTLKTADGHFIIAGSFPELQEYHRDTLEIYLQLQATTAQLFDGITPNEGCTINVF